MIDREQAAGGDPPPAPAPPGLASTGAAAPPFAGAGGEGVSAGAEGEDSEDGASDTIPVCCACGHELVGGYVLAADRPWHMACLSCHFCGQPFPTGEFVTVNDVPHHVECSKVFTLPIQLDESMYVGPLEVREIPGKGRGYVAARDIQPGELLALAFVITTDGCQPSLPLSIMERLPSDPEMFATLLTLHPTAEDLASLPPREIPDMLSAVEGASDEERVRILWAIEHNTHRITDSDPHITRSGPEGSGIFPGATYFNHSCWPNCTRFFHGNVQHVRATRAISAGEEVCDTYVPLYQDGVERRSTLRKFFFECACERCTSREFIERDREVSALRCTRPGCSGALHRSAEEVPFRCWEVLLSTCLPRAPQSWNLRMAAMLRWMLLTLRRWWRRWRAEAAEDFMRVRAMYRELLGKMSLALWPYHELIYRTNRTLIDCHADRREARDCAVMLQEAAGRFLPPNQPTRIVLLMELAASTSDHEERRSLIVEALDMHRLVFGGGLMLFRHRYAKELQLMGVELVASSGGTTAP